MRGVLVAVALVGTCRAACDPCADGLCYTLYSGEDSPSEAEDRCEARGGHLAKVTTAGQVAAVKHVLEFVPDGNCVRFGAIEEAGSWRWTDGTAVTAIDVIENSGGEYCSCYWVEDENVYDAPCHGGWGYGDYYLCATSEGDGSAGCDICDGRGVRCDTVAGYECRTAAGEQVGNSNTHPDMAFAVFNTAADCLTAGHSWTTYTCENSAGFWAEDADRWNLGWTCQDNQDFWDWGGEAGGCCNSHAPGSQCPVETSGDRSSSPSGTTNHGSGKGWCYSDLDDHVGCAASPSDCWAKCEDTYGDNLVAIDWVDEGSHCYCQRDCECMDSVGEDEIYLITRDLAVASLPHECGPDPGDGDDDWYEDWMWANSCRPEYCTSTDGGYGYDCCASMDWGEPATCANGYNPTPPNPSEDYCLYTCCPDPPTPRPTPEPTYSPTLAPTTAPPTSTPTTTASGDDESSDGNGGADAASAGLIAGVVVGVAALAGIAFGAYWFMRAKGGAAEPPMIEVQEMAPAPVPRKDQLYAAAVPVASASPTMPPPPPEPAQEHPSMLSRLASWRAPAAEAPTGRNLFCTACGAPVQGPFCGGCGLRAA